VYDTGYSTSPEAAEERPRAPEPPNHEPVGGGWTIGARSFGVVSLGAILIAAGPTGGRHLALALAITVPALFVASSLGRGRRRLAGPLLAASGTVPAVMAAVFSPACLPLVVPAWIAAFAELASARAARRTGGRAEERAAALSSMARSALAALAFVLVVARGGSIPLATSALAALSVALVLAVDVPHAMAASEAAAERGVPRLALAHGNGHRTDPTRRRVMVGTVIGARRFEASVLGSRPGTGIRLIDAARANGRLLEDLAHETPDEVYFDLAADIDEGVLGEAGARLLMDGVAVHFVLPQIGAPPLRARTERIGGHTVISLHAVRDGLPGRVARRVIDVVGASVLLVVLSPVIAALAVLVRWKMGAPVIHVQERLGRWGKPFPLFKFRSMVPDADELLRRMPAAYKRYRALNFKLPPDEDPRITPLGRFLRRASLDELPQLWNVLRGDMSLVGPRAIVPEEIEQYGDYGRMLLRIKPGLTGIWQVTGRSSVGYPERARMDLEYVEGRSLGLDLSILLRTLPAVLRQRGAV
jgi:lipopolysaccharide/colanic/teichoic acid biosynthesis glycosyltransferase